MATLNKKLLINARLHKALHRNVYLLSLHYSMSADLVSHFKEGMFEKPNGAGFHHLSFYLMSIIDPKSVVSSSWAIFEIKMEAKYRSEILKFVNNLSTEHPGHISHIVPSWIVNAGGMRVAKLMFELSQLALKLHIQRKNNVLNLNIGEMESFDLQNEEKRKILVKKVTFWHIKLMKVQKIIDIFQKHIPLVENERKMKTELLHGIVNKILQNTKQDQKEMVQGLSDIFSPSQLIGLWSDSLNKEIHRLEQRWEENAQNVLSVGRKTRNRSEELVQMHIRPLSQKHTLEFNPNKEKITVPVEYEKEMSIVQTSALKSIISNGIMNFPNLIRAYAVIVCCTFEGYISCQSSADLDSCLVSKSKLTVFVNEKSKDLIVELFKFNNELKEATDIKQNSSLNVRSPLAVYDVLNIPPISPPTYNKEDFSHYWRESVERLHFTNFKHPFKNDKMVYVSAPQRNNERLEHSSVKSERFAFSKEPNAIIRKSVKPDYLKNIEEVNRNMEKINDVHNKTYLSHHNKTSIGIYGTERKLPQFSSHHMKYLLTTGKKKPSIPSKCSPIKASDSPVHKMWGGLFNETIDTSKLQKTRSSPNLSSDDGSMSERRIRQNSARMSGIEEMNNSSLGESRGSMPNLSDSPDKENVVPNVLESTTQSSDTSNVQETSADLNVKRESLNMVIEAYNKFKKERGLGVKTEENKVDPLNLGSIGNKLVTAKQSFSNFPDVVQETNDFE